MFRIKICGMVCLEDILSAACRGVDAVGFLAGIKHRAEDRLSVQKIREITDQMPGGILRVLVTHLTDPERIISMLQETGCSGLQVQEDIDCDALREIRNEMPELPVIKAILLDRSVSEKAVKELLRKYRAYEQLVAGFILDSHNLKEDRIGGTGLPNDWNAAAQIVQFLSKPVILAGGLNPRNVEEAIRTVKPYAVDVNSGVEKGGRSSDGKKDHGLMGAFVENAQKAFKEILDFSDPQ